jgi:hypothetical protein
MMIVMAVSFLLITLAAGSLPQDTLAVMCGLPTGGCPFAMRFGFDGEVLYIAQRLGYRTLEVPIRWSDVAGTKVKMLGALAAFLDPLKVRGNGITGKYR